VRCPAGHPGRRLALQRLNTMPTALENGQRSPIELTRGDADALPTHLSAVRVSS
jgi:hypothetical protein